MSRLEDQIRRFAQVMDSMAPPVEDLMPPELADELDIDQRPGIEVRIPLGGPVRRPRSQLPGWVWGLVGAVAAAVVGVPLLLSLQSDDQPLASQPSTTAAAGVENALAVDLPRQVLAGIGWAPNAEVTATVVGMQNTVDAPTGEPYVARTDGSGNFEIGPIAECCGITVEVSDGLTSRRVDVLGYLQLLRVDPAEDLVAGAVELDTDVTVRITGGEPFETTVRSTNGRWLLDLDGVFDLLPGMIVEATVTTPDLTYTTRDGFYIQNNVDVWLSRGPHLSGWGFLPRSLVEIAIDGEPLPDDVVTSIAGEFDVDLSMYGVELRPGTTIHVTDGIDAHRMVVPSLTFDSFDPQTGNASGTVDAPDGTLLHLGMEIGPADGSGEVHPVFEVVASDGVWIVSFDPLPRGWEVREAWIQYEPQASPFYVHFALP